MFLCYFFVWCQNLLKRHACTYLHVHFVCVYINNCLMCFPLNLDWLSVTCLLYTILSQLQFVGSVLDRTQRHHVEQVKVAIPVILKVLNAISSESNDEDRDSLNDLFGAAISIGTSIQAICEKMVCICLVVAAILTLMFVLMALFMFSSFLWCAIGGKKAGRASGYTWSLCPTKHG